MKGSLGRRESLAVAAAVALAAYLYLVSFPTFVGLAFFISFAAAAIWHDRLTVTTSLLPPPLHEHEDDDDAAAADDAIDRHHNHHHHQQHDASCNHQHQQKGLPRKKGSLQGLPRRGSGVLIDNTSIPCTDCGLENCSRSRPRIMRSQTHPWEFTAIPSIVDAELSSFCTRLLADYVDSWYVPLSDNTEFQQTLKHLLRHVFATLYLRLKRIDLKRLVANEIVDILHDHIQTCITAHSLIIHSHENHSAFNGSSGKVMGAASQPSAGKARAHGHRFGLSALRKSLPSSHAFGLTERLTPTQMRMLERAVVLDSVHAHPATRERDGIITYCRALAHRISPYINTKSAIGSELYHTLLANLLGGVVFEPLFQMMADPDFINTRIIALFDDVENPQKFFQQSPETKQMLSDFCEGSAPVVKFPWEVLKEEAIEKKEREERMAASVYMRSTQEGEDQSNNKDSLRRHTASTSNLQQQQRQEQQGPKHNYERKSTSASAIARSHSTSSMAAQKTATATTATSPAEGASRRFTSPASSSASNHPQLEGGDATTETLPETGDEDVFRIERMDSSASSVIAPAPPPPEERPRMTALTSRLPDVLTDKGTLNAKFQRFLNENNAIEALMFVFNVDNLQTQIIQWRLDAKMAEEEPSQAKTAKRVEEVHSQAQLAYQALEDVHQSDNGFLVDASVLRTIRSTITEFKQYECTPDVHTLKVDKMTAPLVSTFKAAYDAVYQMIDAELFPAFLRSSHYFEAVLHRNAKDLFPLKPKQSHRRTPSTGSTRMHPTAATTASQAESQKGGAKKGKSQSGMRERTLSVLSTTSEAREGGGRSLDILQQSSAAARTPDVGSPLISQVNSDAEDAIGNESSAETLPSSLHGEPGSADTIADDDDQAAESGDDKKEYSLEGFIVRMREPSVRGRLAGKYIVYNMDVTCRTDTDGGSKGRIHPVLGRQWSVSRRYSEFAKLDKILRSFFPDKMALPEKKTLWNMTRRHVQDRKRQLAKYLEALLSNSLLLLDQRCCAAIYYFLEDSNMFRKLGHGSYRFRNILSLKKKRKKVGVDMDDFLAEFIVTTRDLDEAKDEMLKAVKAAEELESLQQLSSANVENPSLTILPQDRERTGGAGLDVPSLMYARASETQPLRDYRDVTDKVLGLARVLFATSSNHWAVDGLFSLAEDVLHSSVEDAITRILDFQLHNSLCEGSVSEYIASLAEVVFDEEYDPSVSEEEQREHEKVARELLQDLLPEGVRKVLGEKHCTVIMDSLLDYFHSPVLNAQLTARIVDVLFEALFPELKGEDEATATATATATTRGSANNAKDAGKSNSS